MATPPTVGRPAGEPWVRWEWIADHGDDILAAVREHVELTVVAVVVGLAIALPLALGVARRPRLAGLALAATGELYSIPSVALIGLLVPMFGLSFLTAEIALVSYTLIILLRNVMAGLEAVPAEVSEAARGMGYGARRQLLTVELPLALPALVAGLRIATVTTIGLVTVTALIGLGGLGQLLLDGFRRDFPTPIVVGATLSVVLAVVADLGLFWLQRLITPWARVRG